MLWEKFYYSRRAYISSTRGLIISWRFISLDNLDTSVLIIYYILSIYKLSTFFVGKPRDASKDSPRTNEKKIAKSLARSSKQRVLPHLFKLKFCTLNQLICSAKLIHVFGNRCSECKLTITCSYVDFFVKIQIYFH